MSLMVEWLWALFNGNQHQEHNERDGLGTGENIFNFLNESACGALIAEQAEQNASIEKFTSPRLRSEIPIFQV